MEYKEASIEIGFFDAEGEPVALPAILDLDTTYIFQVTVTNLTKTRGGKPWEALLEVGVGLSLDAVDVIPYSVATRKFAPNQSVSYTPQIYTKSEYAGMRGKVTAKVIDPFGKILTSVVEPFDIGYEISPHAVYQPSVSEPELEGIDMPFLAPPPEPTEIEMGGVGIKPPPQKPAPPPPKKVEHGPPVSGIDTTPMPEPEPEGEGESVVDGRLG